MRCHITLLVIFGFLCGLGCESSVEPAKVVIHYVPFFCPYLDGPRIYSCDDLVRCDSHLVSAWSYETTLVVCDSILLLDSAAIGHLWSISEDTLSLKKAEGYFGEVRVCAMFLDSREHILRTIALSFEPKMEIDDKQYHRDVPLFRSIVDYLPADYLLKPFWMGNGGMDATKYYYDPELHWFKAASGGYLCPPGFDVMPRAQVTGNPTDKGDCFRIPVSYLTNNERDTGACYIDMKSILSQEPPETLYRSR